MSKPFSQPCENNKQAILDQIKRFYKSGEYVLEIASGTAQHACFFSQKLPGVRWQPSDIASNLTIVLAGLGELKTESLLAPLTLDVQQKVWPLTSVDGVFSANSLHIMPFAAVDSFFVGVGKILVKGGYLCVYGPFKYSGEFTTESNAKFDLWLKERDSNSGIREFEEVNEFANRSGLKFVEDNSLPANNQLIVWQKCER